MWSRVIGIFIAFILFVVVFVAGVASPAGRVGCPRRGVERGGDGRAVEGRGVSDVVSGRRRGDAASEYEGGIGQVNYLHLVGELRSKEGFKKNIISRFPGSKSLGSWGDGDRY